MPLVLHPQNMPTYLKEANEAMKAKIASILALLIIVICAMPFFGPEIKIEWTTYLGMPLVILMGSAGVAFITKRFEAIIGGIVIGALWPFLIELINNAIKLI